jgi:hypothetical protein
MNDKTNKNMAKNAVFAKFRVPLHGNFSLKIPILWLGAFTPVFPVAKTC